MKSLCIMCMQREADPRNGGLCHACAPPLKVKRRQRVTRLRFLEFAGTVYIYGET